MQIINLYQNSLKVTRVDAGRGRVLGLLSLIVCLFGTYTFWLYWDVHRIANDLAAGTFEQQRLAAELDVLRQTVRNRHSDPLVGAENVRLKAQLEKGHALLALIDQGLAEDTGAVSFGQSLLALARQRPESLWLERIRFLSAGREVRLNGVLLQNAALTGYLDRLGSEPVFQGRSFNQMELVPDKRKPGRMVFDIDTRVTVVDKKEPVMDTNEIVVANDAVNETDAAAMGN